jgi:hypothetical protein
VSPDTLRALQDLRAAERAHARAMRAAHVAAVLAFCAALAAFFWTAILWSLSF